MVVLLLKWPKGATYREIAKNYVSHVRQHYGHSSVIFDGYKQGPLINIMNNKEDLRRHVHTFGSMNLCRLGAVPDSLFKFV